MALQNAVIPTPQRLRTDARRFWRDTKRHIDTMVSMGAMPVFGSEKIMA